MECSLSINRYIKGIHRSKMEGECPCCSRRLRKHGSYKRSVVFKRRVYIILVVRLRCPSCDVTFSLLPYFLSPWKRFANHIREFLGRGLLSGIPLSHLPEKLSSTAISILSVRTLRRWKAKLQIQWKDWFQKQRVYMAKQLDAGDGILALYREGGTAEQEREFLLFCFLGKNRVLPRKGSLLSQMNLRFPPRMRW
jgi:hypothetical protein